ncbi:hypothetical protein MA16_Dca017281 [Dendrobium catenatum]|uniref:Secreted protein n=1 Tax=Dendrobium catenatum TaxID=906689 RepID=A0A2I0VU79_9ASPA|nr:hypothetical protein MA16_Dca017281 [Dendrobium catenatum]
MMLCSMPNGNALICLLMIVMMRKSAQVVAPSEDARALLCAKVALSASALVVRSVASQIALVRLALILLTTQQTETLLSVRAFCYQHSENYHQCLLICSV